MRHFPLRVKKSHIQERGIFSTKTWLFITKQIKKEVAIEIIAIVKDSLYLYGLKTICKPKWSLYDSPLDEDVSELPDTHHRSQPSGYSDHFSYSDQPPGKRRK